MATDSPSKKTGFVEEYAVMKYTEPRYTKDLELLIATDEESAGAIYKALRQFGAPLAGLEVADFTSR